MGTAEKKTLKRLGRGIFGLLLSTLIAWFTKEPKAIVAMSIINAGGKYLREKFNIPNVPF